MAWNMPMQAQPTESALDACLLSECMVFPSVKKLLHILATLNEHSFSPLSHLETCLRNTFGENRLNGLVLLNTHMEVTVGPNNVIVKLAKKLIHLTFPLP
jgi:hypothetical protein